MLYIMVKALEVLHAIYIVNSSLMQPLQYFHALREEMNTIPYCRTRSAAKHHMIQ